MLLKNKKSLKGKKGNRNKSKSEKLNNNGIKYKSNVF